MSIFSSSLLIEKRVSCAGKYKRRKLFGVSKGIFLLAILAISLFGFNKQVLAAPQFLAPSNVSATVVTSTSVRLSWTNSYSGSTIGMEVYRDGSYVGDASTGSSATYTVNGVLCGSHVFFLIAYGSSGQVSTSNSVYATAAACASLSGPTLSGSAASETSVNLSWNDPNTAESGYKVYKNSSLIATLGANSTSYTASGMVCSTSSTYYVQAYNTSGSSPASSNSVTVSTTTCPSTQPPIAPSNFTATASGLNSIILTWTDNSNDETGFAVYNNTEYATYTVGANVTSKTLVLYCGQSYSFSIRSYKNSYYSGYVSTSGSTRSCDVTPPSCSLSPAAGTNYSGSSYNVAVSCSDSSGIASINTCTGNNTSCTPNSGSSTNPRNVSITYPVTQLCYYAVDNIGNSSSVSCNTFYLRPTQPNSIDITCNGSGPVTVSWYDTSTIESGYTITRTGAQNATFYTGAKSGFASYTDSTCPVAGNYTYAVEAQNAAGYSNSVSASCYKSSCDSTPPTGSVSFPVSYTNSSSITANVSCSDSGSGCKSWALYNSGSCTGTPVAQGTGSGGSGTVTLSSGLNTKAALLTDNVNLTTCVEGSVTLDTQAPSGSVSINNGAASTSSSSVNLTLSCSDNSDSNPLAVQFKPSLMDKILAWFGFDRVAQAEVAPGADGTGGCRRYDIYTTSSCSGTAQSYGSSPTDGGTASVAATLDAGLGTKYISVQYTDGSGNTSCASDSISVLDTTAPSVPTNLSCSLSPAGNCTGGVYCSWGASTDSGSGVSYYIINDVIGGGTTTSSTTAKSYTGLSAGTHGFIVSAVDNAGNTSGTSSISIVGSVVNDTIAPIISSVTAPAWITSNSTTLNVSASDTGGCGLDKIQVFPFSGCSVPINWTTPVPITYTSNPSIMFDFSSTYSGYGSVRVYDKAGNYACRNTASAVTKDATPPTIDSSLKQSNSNSASFNFSISDNLSGVLVGPYGEIDCKSAVKKSGVIVPSSNISNCTCNSSGCSVSFVYKNNNGTYSIDLSAISASIKDGAGNTLSGTNPSFTIDNSAPAISQN